LNSWSLSVYGEVDNGKDTYIFTSEFADSNGATITDTDSSVEDSINASSLLTDSIINLNDNADSTIAGKTVHIAEESVIENAYAGDGDDTLIGNEFNNILFGGRGDDTLTGNAGNDTFEIFKHENQTDTITDFEINNTEEKIDLTRFKFNSFEDLTITQQDSDSIIDLGNNQKIILQNTIASLLTAANFKGFLNEAITLNGTDNRDNLYADERDSIINAGAGDDYISGSIGNNTLTGGDGSDLFFIDVNPNKADTITDFDINNINERISQAPQAR